MSLLAVADGERAGKKRELETYIGSKYQEWKQ